MVMVIQNGDNSYLFVNGKKYNFKAGNKIFFFENISHNKWILNHNWVI